MTETCVGCEKEYIVCTHNVCGDDKGNCLITHASCDEYGCGECMQKCAGSSHDEYCNECFEKAAQENRYDWYTRRMENGWME